MPNHDQNRFYRNEDASDDFASRACLACLFLLVVVSLIYRFTKEIQADRPASPDRVAEVSRQTQSTLWEKCSIEYYRPHTPGTYITEQLKAGHSIDNATLDFLVEKVEQCNEQQRKKMADKLHAAAQKAAIN